MEIKKFKNIQLRLGCLSMDVTTQHATFPHGVSFLQVPRFLVCDWLPETDNTTPVHRQLDFIYHHCIDN